MKPKKINNSRKGGNSLDMNQTSQLFFLGGGDALYHYCKHYLQYAKFANFTLKISETSNMF